MTHIYDLLYSLGVTANYTGFFHMAYAVSLCVEQPDRLLLVTKWLYPEVAKQYNTNWKAVERNIRTVSCIIWQENRSLLEELAHRRLERKPQNAQMLAILASSLDTGSLAVHGLDETAHPQHRRVYGGRPEAAAEATAHSDTMEEQGCQSRYSSVKLRSLPCSSFPD